MPASLRCCERPSSGAGEGGAAGCAGLQHRALWCQPCGRGSGSPGTTRLCLPRLGQRRGTAVPAKSWRSSSTRSGTCRGTGAPGGCGGHGGCGGSPRLSPRRLLWPKSKAFDHLYSVGEKLLENFPVQATLFFYEDSASEEEEEEEEEKDDEEEEATGDVTAGHPRYAGSHSRPE